MNEFPKFTKHLVFFYKHTWMVVSIGSRTVIHPKARIVAEAGPIIIGENNLIEEQTQIINRWIFVRFRPHVKLEELCFFVLEKSMTQKIQTRLSCLSETVMFLKLTAVSLNTSYLLPIQFSRVFGLLIMVILKLKCRPSNRSIIIEIAFQNVSRFHD